MKTPPYDSLLLLTYGGPECAADVAPFLDRVLAGKPISDRRRREVESHYAHFAGVSPINAHARTLRQMLEEKTDVPVYWACRHTAPFLPDVFRQMAADGVRRTLVFVPSPFGGTASDGVYRDALAAAAAEVGKKAPQWTKIPPFYAHPGFIAAQADVLTQAENERAVLLFTAHSVPLALADTPEYARQVAACMEHIRAAVGAEVPAYLAWQSASGRPGTWLEPGVEETLRRIAATDPRATVLALPVGFPLENMEIVYDLDTQAAAYAHSLGLTFRRLPTVGTHPRLVEMVMEYL